MIGGRGLFSDLGPVSQEVPFSGLGHYQNQRAYWRRLQKMTFTKQLAHTCQMP